MGRLVLVVVAVAAVLAGCSHGTKQVKPKPSACARARVEALGRPERNALRGDVTGDGVPDRVSVVRLRGTRARCGAFLIVRSRGRTLTRPIATSPQSELPNLTGLAAIGPGRSLQIVVTPWEGASTAFARVLAIRSGRIAVLTNGLTDPQGETGNTFPYEGSVTHFNGIDCVRPGVIIASGYYEKGVTGPPFGFERRSYRVGGKRFELIHTQRGTTRTNLSLRNPMREFREPQPFPSCMRVRAAS